MRADELVLELLRADELEEYPASPTLGTSAGIVGPGGLTSSDLARLSALSPAVVCQALTALRRRGLVEPSGYRLLDASALCWCESEWSTRILDAVKSGPRSGADLARICGAMVDGGPSGAFKSALRELVAVGALDAPAQIYLSARGRRDEERAGAA